MNKNKPRVSIGMPVFNGEQYIAKALDSFLSQTYKDFEIIISDNASNDATEEICKTYVAKDNRIRYVRNKKNLGAVKNYNRVFELSVGEYFKWAAHDDLCAPEYLERCIELLSQHPSAVICHPKTSIINEHGKLLGNWDDHLDYRSNIPHERFRDYLFRRSGLWNAIFGVMRSSELKKTPLFGNYLGCDKVLLGELILRGKVYQIQERLFFRRRHAQQWWRVSPTRKQKDLWLDPENRGKIQLPIIWKNFFGYLWAIRRVRLQWKEQTWCYFYLMKWLYKQFAGSFIRRLRKIRKQQTSDANIWESQK